MIKIKPKNYCVKCGGLGVDAYNNPCECSIRADVFDGTYSCLDIPQQYRGTMFNKLLVPSDCGLDYADYLESVFEKVTSMQWQGKNVVIASPVQHSKTILAYSCIEMLFRGNIPVFPVYDVLELYRAMIDGDLGRKASNDIAEPENIVKVPILFAKIPRVVRWELYDAIALIVSRRVARGNSTLFLYDGAWWQLTANDKNGTLTGMMGDGSFGTLEVKTWETVHKKAEVTLQDNIG